MMRYVAQRGKLWGSTAEEAALIDMVAEGVKDARGVVVSYPFTPEKAGLAIVRCRCGNDTFCSAGDAGCGSSSQDPLRLEGSCKDVLFAIGRTAKQLQPLEALVQKRPDGTLGFVSSGLCAADVLFHS